MSAGSAQAQWIGTPAGDGATSAAPAPAPMESVEPMAPAMPAPTFAAPAAAPQRASVDCQGDVDKLRADIETNGKAIQAASKRKATPIEVCPIFRRYVTAEQKFVAYLEKNQEACGVPGEAIKSLKTNNGKAAATRDKVCQIAAQQQEKGAGGGEAPRQGQLSSGLGLQNSLPGVGSGKSGGVFDTLGGSALR
ncbi:hypothetical protein [Ancylobacter terrae]|uniref:hypothetical protein n=1 Tax=Ancylobacter sp. sgz301288 TaxID=3342077 RepID=UPI00385A3222